MHTLQECCQKTNSANVFNTIKTVDLLASVGCTRALSNVEFSLPAPKTNANMLPPYPGQPKKRVPPVHVKDFALYTDMRMRAWRLKRHGEKRDKAFGFRKDPEDAWNKLRKVIRTG